MANHMFSMALGETQAQITENNSSTAITDLPAAEVGILIGGSLNPNKQVTIMSALETAIRYARENKYLAPTAGVVTGVTIAGGGTGYTVSDVLTASGGSGTGLTLTVATESAGVITGVTVTTGGSGYLTSDTGLTVTGGSGTGATFDIATTNSIKVVTIDVATRVITFADDTALDATKLQIMWDDTYAAVPNASLMFDKTFEQLERYVQQFLKNRTTL